MQVISWILIRTCLRQQNLYDEPYVVEKIHVYVNEKDQDTTVGLYQSTKQRPQTLFTVEQFCLLCLNLRALDAES